MQENKEKQIAMPRHVGLIMDGNGRWAKLRNKMPLFGHRAGSKPIRDCIEVCAELGIKNLSLFAFSSENWSRPESEVQGLMDLFKKSLIDELPKLQKHEIRLKILGDKTGFEPQLQELMQNAEQQTKDNKKLNLILALNYGGQWEIVETAKKLAEQVFRGELKTSDIDASAFENNLTDASIPPVDLCVRTSGEQRISNFYLWQMAYAEFYFSNTLWPDFNKKEFIYILEDFAKRQRNFGKR